MKTIINKFKNWSSSHFSNEWPVLIFILLYLCLFNTAKAQEKADPVMLYEKARSEAYEYENYSEAIELMENAISHSPENTDMILFLGQLYSWTKQYDKARPLLKSTFESTKASEDASLAYANLEFWSKDVEKALEIVNKGLETNEASYALMLLKARILNDLNRTQEAKSLLETAVKSDPKDEEAKKLLQNLNTEILHNELGIIYEFVNFDERINDPWHLVHLHYSRNTGMGPLTGRLSYGNKFNTGSVQFETDFYPKISKTFYGYLNAGISNDKGIFPEYRAGASLYANLPSAFEADAGFRLLYFDESTWVYTFGLGKYYKDFWFNFRTYLAPGDSGTANSYNLSARYYFGAKEEYVGIRVGTGFSPDDAANNILLSTENLRSNNLEIDFRKLILKSQLILVRIGYENIEFSDTTKIDQFTASLGYIKRF
ncbi:YaiO family outer membrane beta-barrel protein [Robertkochia solimangrovi]|uniref:YaiO family outer membrane beta-barrel protein n=1 Tax=Robertkochia solimangrovi TaxID=2213046 RepID=UPI00117CFC73|nr:YaiO family outer membrane beta-barrel protein [Robertkochia solimangrovi]TRZ44340.1 hypothetical protein DMZ48_07460 [Robertkochia solimangrovi]